MPPRHAKRQKGVNARVRDLERFLKLVSPTKRKRERERIPFFRSSLFSLFQPTLAADLRETKERELQALLDVRKDKERVEREKKMAKRYRMVKFFGELSPSSLSFSLFFLSFFPLIVVWKEDAVIAGIEE
jgi:hypothetical protein